MSKQYSIEDEGSREAGTDDPDWQESVFVHWYDRSAGIGGVSRIGHEPNRPGGGRSALQCFVATNGGTRFRRNDFQLPYEDAATPRGFRSGGSDWQVDSERPRLTINEPGLVVDVVMDVRLPGAEDRYGICDFEVSNNARMGTAPIGLALKAAIAQGMSKREY